MENLVHNGRFIVAIYCECQINLKKINIRPEDQWALKDVGHSKGDEPEGTHTMFWGQLLTEMKP